MSQGQCAEDDLLDSYGRISRHVWQTKIFHNRCILAAMSNNTTFTVLLGDLLPPLPLNSPDDNYEVADQPDTLDRGKH